MALNAVVVEDNAVFRQELTEYLEAFVGIELIDSFRNGEEFLVQLARLKPDVVLLDIGMPGRSGIEIAAVLRQERPTVEIIFITSFEEHIKDGVRLYAADYITKPLDTKRLDETLCRILTKFPRIEKRVELKVTFIANRKVKDKDDRISSYWNEIKYIFKYENGEWLIDQVNLIKSGWG